jgi:hypothetical protein
MNPSLHRASLLAQEGCTVVADAFSKYEYEVFSGSVVSTKSEALQVGRFLSGKRECRKG